MQSFRIFDKVRVLIVGATILFSLSLFSATAGAQQEEKLSIDKSWINFYYTQGRTYYEMQSYVLAYQYISVYYTILFGNGILQKFPDSLGELDQIMSFLREYLNTAVTERASLAAQLDQCTQAKGEVHYRGTASMPSRPQMRPNAPNW